MAILLAQASDFRSARGASLPFASLDSAFGFTFDWAIPVGIARRAPSYTPAMTTLRAWVRAARPLAQGNIAPPIVFGAALACANEDRSLRLVMLALALAFGLLDHLLIVFTNDYADRDHDTDHRTFASGGSGVLQSGALKPPALRRAAWAMALALLALSTALAAFSFPWMLAAWLAACVLLVLYSLPPFAFSYRGGGELLQGLGVGVVLPLVGFYLQRGTLAIPTSDLIAGFLLAASGNIATALPDVQADRAADKRTLAVFIERRAAGMVASFLGATATVVFFARNASEETIGGIALGVAFIVFVGAGALGRRALAYVVMHGAATQLVWLGLAAHWLWS